MFSVLRSKISRVLLAAALAIPAGGMATFATAVPAHADCYYSGYMSDVAYAYPANGVTWYSYVEYTLGYDCSGSPTSINVSYLHDQLRVSDSWGYHQSTAAAVIQYENGPVDWYTSYNPGGCQSSCTVDRQAWPNVWLPYDPNASVWEHYAGCDQAGYGWCETYHQFITGYAYSYWGG